MLAGGTKDLWDSGQPIMMMPLWTMGENTFTYANERKVASVVPVAGRFFKFTVDLQADIGNVGDEAIFMVRHAPVSTGVWGDSAITCTITGTGGLDDSTCCGTGALDVSPGDLVAVEIDWGASTIDPPVYPGWGIAFQPDVSGESIIAGRAKRTNTGVRHAPVASQSHDVYSNADKVYVPIAGTGSNITISDLYVNIGAAAPLTAGSLLVRVSKNGALLDTTLECTLAWDAGGTGDYECSDTVGSLSMDQTVGDYLSIIVYTTDAVPATNHVSYGVKMTSSKSEYLICNTSEDMLTPDDIDSYRALGSHTQEVLVADVDHVEAPTPLAAVATSAAMMVSVAPGAVSDVWGFSLVVDAIGAHCSVGVLYDELWYWTTNECTATIPAGSQISMGIVQATTPEPAYAGACFSLETR
jgi:hypothetical protein